MIRERIVIFLTLLIGVICIGLLLKHEIVTESILADKKEIIGVIKDIITITAIVIGAILTYFKFFAGQTFFPKADVDFQVAIIETPEKKLLHTIRVIVTNKGNITIWNPVAHINIQRWGDNSKKEENIEQFIEHHYLDDKKEHDTIIDPGETIHFVIWRKFEQDIWAITYSAEISSKSGRKWQNLITIPNKVSTKANTV